MSEFSQEGTPPVDQPDAQAPENGAEATPVVAAQPSNAVEAPAPEVDETPFESFEDEVRKFVAIVEEGHKLGAREMSEAIDRVKSFL